MYTGAGRKGVQSAILVLTDGKPSAEVRFRPQCPNSKGGVVGMLEVIESDFARLEADTKSAEASAQKEYDEFMDDSSDDKAKKATDIEHKTAKKQDESQALRDLEWQGNCLSAA